MTAGRSPTVAVIGCGYWGQNLVRNFSEIGSLSAISDASASSAARTSATYGVPARTVEDLLADVDVDAVALATPAESHASLALRALGAGKHVFVEKPLALSTADAESVCAAADDAGLTLMVGHLLQYHPAFIRLKERVREGSVGRIEYVYSNRLNLGRVRREEDILWSFAPHDISMILSLVGSEPERITAIGASYLHKSIADVTTTHMAFPGGEQAHVFVSWLHPFKEQKLIVVGDNGMIVFDDAEPWESKLTIYEHRINWREGLPKTVKAEGQPMAVERAEPLAEECRHFVECTATGSTPRTDGREGLRVLRVLEAASESLRTGSSTALTVAPSGGNAASTDGLAYFIHPSSYVDVGTVIGAGTKVWHFSHLLQNTQIGKHCSLGQNVVVGPDVIVGDNCKIQNNVSIVKGVTLEDGVFCGPSCVFTNVLNPRAEVSRRDEFQETYVRRGTTIGANATIVCGNEIGEFSFIGAGAVVTRDVPAHALMVGVPARRVGWVSHAAEVLGEDLVCSRTGRKYVEIAPGELRELED